MPLFLATTNEALQGWALLGDNVKDKMILLNENPWKLFQNMRLCEALQRGYKA